MNLSSSTTRTPFILPLFNVSKNKHSINDQQIVNLYSWKNFEKRNLYNKLTSHFVFDFQSHDHFFEYWMCVRNIFDVIVFEIYHFHNSKIARIFIRENDYNEKKTFNLTIVKMTFFTNYKCANFLFFVAYDSGFAKKKYWNDFNAKQYYSVILKFSMLV